MTFLAYLNIFLVVVLFVVVEQKIVGKSQRNAAIAGFLTIVLLISTFTTSIGVLLAWQ